jgi:long-chain acyl-CoA synthetase
MEITEPDLPLQLAFRWERERADRKFLTQPFGGGQVRHWTWAQAVAEARSLATFLRAQDWEPGTRIAILSKNCAWWIMADLAIWMAGHVSVPIYPSLRPQSIRQILEHSGAKACFLGATDDPSADPGLLPNLTWITFPTARAETDLSWQSLVDSNAPLAGNPSPHPDDLATIIYTSGTTGTPKGVMHRFGALAWDAKALVARLGLKGEQRVLSYLPLAHIVERAGVEALTLRLGTRVFFAESIETFVNDLQRTRPTLFISVPRLFVKFQQGVFAKIAKEKLDKLLRIPAVNLFVKRKILRQLGLNTVHMAASGAAPLPTEILLWYRKLGLALAEGYGMTETMVTHLPGPADVRPGFVGGPLEGVETRLSPTGELLVRSPMNMLGYFGDPKGTREAFGDDGFFKTGDLVELDPSGQLKIIGRTKEQFKTSKGKYVAPAPIESRLMEHPSVEACCLMGEGLPSPFAVVLLSDAIRQECADPEARKRIEDNLLARMEEVNGELDPFARLSMLVIADGPWSIANGMMTPTLKIRRGVLESRYAQLVADWKSQNRTVVWESLPGTGAYIAGAASENAARPSDVPPSQT